MSTGDAFRHLYREGGVRRFYRGVGPALLQARFAHALRQAPLAQTLARMALTRAVTTQAPLARFGDTAANAGTLALLNDVESTRNLPVWVKTGARACLCRLHLLRLASHMHLCLSVLRAARIAAARRGVRGRGRLPHPAHAHRRMQGMCTTTRIDDANICNISLTHTPHALRPSHTRADGDAG